MNGLHLLAAVVGAAAFILAWRWAYPEDNDKENDR